MGPSSLHRHSWLSSKYFWSSASDLGDLCHSDTAVWRGILAGLSELRDATLVNVGSGNATFFWLDLWLGNVELAVAFPALFSHCLRPNCSVALALASPNLFLRPALTNAAATELESLLLLLSTVSVQHEVPDQRSLRSSPSTGLSASVLYAYSFSHLPNDAFAPFIWRNAAPPRCKSFLWLLHHEKLNTNARLRSRGADNDGNCSFCGLIEDTAHLFFSLPSCYPVLE